ncbi:hypothetical protein D1BOALGB6SA_1173 [Olavius sp. associated proteobacterium Delta 1]|nr:hypothetical protein D1BOALGB6SA_1173 [Olavius sp. associated proteobacterium Delta 1]
MENTLSKYKPIADAIASLLHPYAEVVIHDIIKDIIVHIANPYSKRRVGDSSYLGLDGDESDFGLEMNVLGPYEKEGEDGQRVRSITAVLRNDEAQPIGILCINLDFSPLETAFESAFEVLNGLIRPAEIEARPEIIFREEWRELIKLEIRAFRLEKGLAQDSMNASERRELMRRLDQKRLFYARKSVEQVASYLMISRATAYKDLNEIRKGNGNIF